MTTTAAAPPVAGTAAPAHALTPAHAARPRSVDPLRRLITADRLWALGVFAAAIVIGLWNVEDAPSYQDDEGIYTAQAVAVQNGGLAPYTYWYDHPPLGWIQYALFGAIPQALGAGGGLDIAAMRYVSGTMFAVTVLLVYLLARRIGTGVVFALLPAALLAFSPLALEVGRQVFLDVIATPWVLLAFLLMLSPRRALWHHIGGGIAFAVAMLTKLTFAVFGPALLMALLSRGRWRGRGFSIVGFVAVGALVGLLFPIMAALRGELISGPGHVSLQDGLAYQFLERSGSGWIWESGSQRNDLFAHWLSSGGFLVGGGLLAAAVCLASRRTRWISAAIACFALPIVGSQGYLPAMYVIGALPMLALAIGAAAHGVWRRARRFLRHRMPGARVGGPLLVGAVIAVFVVALPAGHIAGRGAPMLTMSENANWRSAMSWIDRHVPREHEIIVPYSMWQDVAARGWTDPWRVIALEKIDLDEEFTAEHPGGWRELEWIVEGPTVSHTIEGLALETAGDAFRSSRIVAEFGEWNIRRIDPNGPATETTDSSGDAP